MAAFRDIADSAELRARLEELSREIAFSGLTYLWGPELYARAPLFFRPFLMAHFSSVAIEKKWKFRTVEWKREVGERLERWLLEVDRDGDVELYRMLYSWRLLSQHGIRSSKQYQKDLVERFSAAPDDAARRRELARHDLHYWLEEDTAVSLYQRAPALVTPFILKHLPRSYSLFSGEKRVWWKELAGQAQRRGDDDLYFSLYRRQASLEQWRRDALELCRSEKDQGALLRELRRRHPDVWDKDLGTGFAELLAARGEELFPYVLPEIDKVLRGFFNPGFAKLIALAEQRGWLELWGALMRACATPAEFEKAVLSNLDRPAAEGRQRLLLLTGVGLELNLPGLGLARVLPFSDKVASAVYGKYPELLRGPMRIHLVPNTDNGYDQLVGQLIGQGDEDLLDFLASRFATAGYGVHRKTRFLATVERLADHYEALQRDPQRFARRAAAVLGFAPAFAVWGYDDLIRKNRLARLLYERSASFYLRDAQALGDLLEAPEIHAQALAYRALGQPEEEARRQALGNLELLLGALLRPLHRRTRLLAFAALENAAHEPEAAARILSRARDALGLPDSHYPKDHLVGMIGRILHRHPHLRGEREVPRIYRRSPCSESA